MSVVGTLKLMLKLKDISTSDQVSSQDNSRTWSGGDVEKELKSTSSPTGEDCAHVTVTLSGGAASLDLTSLSHIDGGTRSVSGKKLRAWLFTNPSANLITVSKGASNGYSPVGTTFTKPVGAGCTSADYFDDEAAAVSGSAKTLDFAGTGSQTITVKLLWGT